MGKNHRLDEHPSKAKILGESSRQPTMGYNAALPQDMVVVGLTDQESKNVNLSLLSDHLLRPLAHIIRRKASPLQKTCASGEEEDTTHIICRRPTHIHTQEPVLRASYGFRTFLQLFNRVELVPVGRERIHGRNRGRGGGGGIR